MELLYLLVTLGSILAAVLAWVVKLRWAKEYATSKDEVIRSKEAHIQLLEREVAALKDQTPRVIIDHHAEVRDELVKALEETRAFLASKSQLDDAVFTGLAEAIAHVFERMEPDDETLASLPHGTKLLLKDLLLFMAISCREGDSRRATALAAWCVHLLDLAEAQAQSVGSPLKERDYHSQIRPPRSVLFAELPERSDQGIITRMFSGERAANLEVHRIRPRAAHPGR